MKQNKPKIGNLGFYAVKKKVASIKKSRPAWGVFTFSKGIWQFAGAGRKGSTLHWLTPNAMVQSTAGPELQRMGPGLFAHSLQVSAEHRQDVGGHCFGIAHRSYQAEPIWNPVDHCARRNPDHRQA